MAKVDPSTLQAVNPFQKTGPKAQAIQIAAEQINPAQAARWRVESGETVSLAAAAAKAGLTEMNRSIHEELQQLDADYITGQQEAAARREADLLASLEKGANDLAEAREKQQAQFNRQSGNNQSGGGYNRDFIRRFGDHQQQQRTPARRVVGK